MSLTPKRQRFVEEYPKDLNATQAYIRAGYSQNGAHKLASRLMANGDIAAAIEQALAERSERTGIEADHVLQRLAAVGLADPRDVVTWSSSGVTIRDSAELTPEQAATVAEVTHRVTKEGSTVTVKLRDPMPALSLLAKHTGVVKDGTLINIDNRQQTITLPEGTTLDDLKALRDQLGGE